MQKCRFQNWVNGLFSIVRVYNISPSPGDSYSIHLPWGIVWILEGVLLTRGLSSVPVLDVRGTFNSNNDGETN